MRRIISHRSAGQLRYQPHIKSNSHSRLIPQLLNSGYYKNGNFSLRNHEPGHWRQHCRSIVSSKDSGEKNHTSLTKMTVEEQYIRKTPLEHILLRPGMYVGPVERLPPSALWIAACKNKEWKLERKEASLIPALSKIFDEILVNASDNRLRHPKSCHKIDVVIDKDKNLISVRNNGKSIPMTMHKKEKIHVPELLFGHLLTGSNFEDEKQKKVTGGRHGYGAKLTNIFSKKFTVEIGDASRQRIYTQTWEKNMSIIHPPKIFNSEVADDYTFITYEPDLSLFSTNDKKKLKSIPDDDYQLMCRRVLDVAGCSSDLLSSSSSKPLQVTLNGELVPIHSFEEYVRLYRNGTADSAPLFVSKINSRWQVAISLSTSPSANLSSKVVSFVNGMSTHRGGTHVQAIMQQIIQRIIKHVQKTYPSDLANSVTPALVRRHMNVFVNALIENPTFDSQMKESLTLSPLNFGSRFSLSERFLSELCSDESGIIEAIMQSAQQKQQAELSRLLNSKKPPRNARRKHMLNIPKLDDANLAGTEESGRDCTLILTEGDSAKALAVAGLEIIKRDLYGVFPLRGKFLNVRDASIAQLTKNAEIKALCTILGLDFEKTYETVEERNTLRYGHVMLMTDQDADGSHIKGLMMNFFRHFWPALLKPIGDDDSYEFLSSFVTPLLKATRKKNKQVETFFSFNEYLHWRSSLIEKGDDIKNWNVKYYKGLGTSTPAEAKQYFQAFVDHHRPYRWQSEEKDGALLDMVFDKHRASDRRDWITNMYNSDNLLATESDDVTVTYEDFINKELVNFSNADNVRSLPSYIDGLKPSQRKVLYACFKRKLKNEIKVAQLTGYCAEHTAYHHGEASLHATSKEYILYIYT